MNHNMDINALLNTPSLTYFWQMVGALSKHCSKFRLEITGKKKT